MSQQPQRKKGRPDALLLILVIFLAVFGLVFLYSSSSYNGRVRFHDSFYYFKKQLFATALGLAAMYVVSETDYHFWVSLAPVVYLMSVVLSTAVLLVGQEINGSKRWLSLGPLSFQPSEFAKVAVILFLAWQIDRSRKKTSGIWFMCRTMATLLPIVGLVGSNNLSTAIIILGIGVILVWFFSRQISEPILELAELSKKMAKLDFDAKYTRGGVDEIGILGKSFNTMSDELKEKISELKTANYELQKDIKKKEQIETMRTEFIGNVSHELKTPIALIQGYAEGLKDGITDDPESMEFYCDVIIDEAGKMNRMVKNLLTLNQLELGRDDTQFERIDITSLIQGVVQSLDIVARQKEVDVRMNVSGPVYVWADEFKVEQVVRNYVNNALNHVDGQRIIDIRIEEREGKIRVNVFNTGKPIPEEDIAHIWEKFYKVDKARTREYGGNGIGLSIVKAIMESFHQNYGVRNYENGVQFWFELDKK